MRLSWAQCPSHVALHFEDLPAAVMHAISAASTDTPTSTTSTGTGLHRTPTCSDPPLPLLSLALVQSHISSPAEHKRQQTRRRQQQQQRRKRRKRRSVLVLSFVAEVQGLATPAMLPARTDGDDDEANEDHRHTTRQQLQEQQHNQHQCVVNRYQVTFEIPLFGAVLPLPQAADTFNGFIIASSTAASSSTTTATSSSSSSLSPLLSIEDLLRMPFGGSQCYFNNHQQLHHSGGSIGAMMVPSRLRVMMKKDLVVGGEDAEDDHQHGNEAKRQNATKSTRKEKWRSCLCLPKEDARHTPTTTANATASSHHIPAAEAADVAAPARRAQIIVKVTKYACDLQPQQHRHVVDKDGTAAAAVSSQSCTIEEERGGEFWASFAPQLSYDWSGEAEMRRVVFGGDGGMIELSDEEEEEADRSSSSSSVLKTGDREPPSRTLKTVAAPTSQATTTTTATNLPHDQATMGTQNPQRRSPRMQQQQKQRQREFDRLLDSDTAFYFSAASSTTAAVAASGEGKKEKTNNDKTGTTGQDDGKPHNKSKSRSRSPSTSSTSSTTTTSSTSTTVSSLNSSELEEDFTDGLMEQIADEQGMQLAPEFYEQNAHKRHRIIEKKATKVAQIKRRRERLARREEHAVMAALRKEAKRMLRHALDDDDSSSSRSCDDDTTTMMNQTNETKTTTSSLQDQRDEAAKERFRAAVAKTHHHQDERHQQVQSTLLSLALSLFCTAHAPVTAAVLTALIAVSVVFVYRFTL